MSYKVCSLRLSLIYLKGNNDREGKGMVVGEKNDVVIIDNYLLYVSVVTYQIIQL